MIKIKTYPDFPLTSTCNRMALLLGIHHGQVPTEQLETAIIQDSGPRPYRKAVVVEGRRFDSVTDAAHWVSRTQPNMRNLQNGNHTGDHATIQRLVKRISRWCTDDNRDGYYWTM